MKRVVAFRGCLGIAILITIALGAVHVIAPPGALAAGQAKLRLVTEAGSPMTPTGIATNRTGAGGVTAGDFYVADLGNNRVAHFSAEGDFVSVFGLGVNQTTGGDVCTSASGDVCQGGAESGAAGAVPFPIGVAVNQTTGTVFVYSDAGLRVNVFSAQGVFQGAFGWEVDAVNPEPELQFCTLASGGCSNGVLTAEAGGFGGGNVSTRTMDVDAAGNLYVPDLGNRRIDQFSFTFNGSDEVTGVSFVRAIGWRVNAASPEEKLQTCTTVSGCLQGTSGNGDGQFGSQLTSVAVDSAGSLYALSAGDQSCATADPCRVQKFNADGTFKEVFGPTAGTCRLLVDDSSIASLGQGLAVAVDPSTQNILVLKRVASQEMQLCEFDSQGNELALFPSPAMALDYADVLQAGLAIGLGGYVYASNGFPGLYLLGPAPAPGSQILPATEVGQASARLNGVVTVPVYKSGGFPTTYQFEISADLGATWAKLPVPAASAGEVPGPVSVQETATGLEPNKTYRVRLVATTGPSVTSLEQQFKTTGAAPSVAYAPGANPLTDPVNPYLPTSARLAGFVNPNNQNTTYRFEYGLTTAYGLQSPAELEPFAGEGGTPLLVKANLSGLQPATVYHYRIVATNASGITRGPDRQFETSEQRQVLNSCGLPDGRCLEMVSPADKGPVASVGTSAASADLQAQPSSTGDGIAYQLGNGLPNSTAPNEVLYRSTRGATGWTAAQLSPPLTEQNQTKEPSALSGYTRGLSADLSCGVLLSPFRLTADTPTRVIEAGGTNLYRRDNLTGAYEVITNLPPTNAPPGIQVPLSTGEYELIGMSDDCRRVIFSTPYLYPGVSGATVAPGANAVYEWEDGDLQGVGIVPGPSGEVAVPATAGAPQCCNAPAMPNALSAVSRVGRRVAFTATSQLGADEGTAAVFSRLDGSSTVDVSQSETGTGTNGARFQAASADGRKVFFTANYGIAAESSSGPESENCANATFEGNSCDLYEYDFNAPVGQRLTDLSAHTAEPGGAAVAGVIATSGDGGHVYFAARGQLVAGAGPTFAENQSAGTYSVYLANAGSRYFVGVVNEANLIGPGAVLMSSNRGLNPGDGWAAQVTPDGKHLLFGSSADVTGFDPKGTVQAYLYSADADVTVCVSCRRDGGSPGSGSLVPLPPMTVSNGLRPLLALTPNGERAFFLSRDSLTPGAVEGEINLYEWRRGQTYLLAAAEQLNYQGVSDDGTDVYFATPKQMNWEDKDERADLYVARSGGGFTQPVTPVPCNPLIESSCAGAPGIAPPVAALPPSMIFSGPGNPPPDKGSKKKQKNKKKKKGKKKKGQGKGSGSKARIAHGNRGTSK